MSGAGTNGGAAGESLLELRDGTAFYGDLQALFGITLQARAGEIVTLIGSNGAGKTTILRVISGIKHAASGSLRMEGSEVSRVPAHEMVARGVSHIPEGRQVFPYLTVRENLSLGAYTPRARAHARESMEEQLKLFPLLGDRLNQLAGALFRGAQHMGALPARVVSQPLLSPLG